MKNNFPNCYKQLLDVLEFPKQEISTENYCQKCKSSLITDENSKFKCSKTDCKFYSSPILSPDKFCYVPIKSQLLLLIEEYKHDLFHFQQSSFKDLTNSSFYQNLAHPNVWHLLLYSDGISLANSSSYSCWPVLISLAELPASVRQSKKGTIM